MNSTIYIFFAGYRGADHSGHCHHHLAGGRPGHPGALQAGAGPHRRGVLQERVRQPGPALLCLLRAHHGTKEQVLRDGMDAPGQVRILDYIS